MQALIEFNNVDVVINGTPILRDINWQLFPRQHWAVLGPNGSGKSTFLKLVRGEVWPVPSRGRRVYRLNGREQVTSAVGVNERIGVVSPELQERYLQQEWRFTAHETILSGLLNTDYVYRKPTAEQRASIDGIIDLLNVREFLRRNVQQLSTGELRKVLIARALAGNPQLLVFDEVCDGLDVPSRAELLDCIDHVAKQGTQLLIATHRPEELVPSITHLIELREGIVRREGTLKGEQQTPTRTTVARCSPFRVSGVIRCPPSRVFDSAPALIEVERANVFLGHKRVLQDISWRMAANENWVIVGPNGAGKSTFLKMLAGDLHPAFGGSIRRFNLTEKNTLWDLRRRIGYFSPELQANYRDSITGNDVVASGFTSSVGLVHTPTRDQRKRVRQLLQHFGLEHLRRKRVGQMSYGEFRGVLLLRALVHSPSILLCDEPFDGLDAESKQHFRNALERASAAGTRLVIVTHHVEELPRCITHQLELREGRILTAGPISHVIAAN